MIDKSLLKDIGKRICSRRKQLKMTQEMLAEQMNVSVQMISNLEQGKKAIRPENLIKLCTTLQVSTDYILRGYLTNLELDNLSNKLSRLSEERKALVEALINELLK